MMKSLKKQQGYMAVVIGFLIATIAFTSLVTSYQFSNKALSVSNSLLSMQSFYLAMSGIERAKYDITVNKSACTSINGTAAYTNATFTGAAGVFTVTGAITQVNNTLNGSLTSSATTIPLVSSTGFASIGTVLIDNELINYTAISGNNLTGASRGAGGSTAASHNSGALVSENQCLLTSSGGVPSLTSPLTKRVINAILIASSFSPGQNSSGAGTGQGSGNGAGSGMFQTAMAVGGSVSLNNGAVISNGSVTTSSANFSGSTIMSGGPVVINNGGKTQVSNGGGGFVTSSNSSGIAADISQNNSNVTSANLWNNFFTQSKATVQSTADQTYNSSNINGATGKTIWTSDLSLNSNTTIGAQTSPVILIVSGNLNTSAAFTMNGLLYVTGSVALNGSSSTINGLFANEGALNTNGPTTIVYNPGILTKSGGINSNSTTVYSIVPSSVQEQFP